MNVIKPSHIRVPRTARDATWAAWGDPIEPPDEQSWLRLHMVIAAIGVGVVAALLIGWI